jgi:hypothetical protein
MAEHDAFRYPTGCRTQYAPESGGSTAISHKCTQSNVFGATTQYGMFQPYGRYGLKILYCVRVP